MTYTQAYNRVSKWNGWMGQEDCKVLWEEAEKVEGTILEIGGYAGISTVIMALASPKSKVVVIDPFLKDIPSNIYPEFLEHIKGLNIKHIREKSEDALWTKKVDLIHVDGDHRFRVVQNDIERYTRYLKKGAHMLIHDYANDPELFGVNKAVNESGFKFDLVSGFARICG